MKKVIQTLIDQTPIDYRQRRWRINDRCVHFKGRIANKW